MVGVVILLTSCNKDLDLDIKYQLTVDIDNMDVVKNLKNYNNADLFPNGVIGIKDYKVRVSSMLYNSAGVLVSEDIQFVDDFSKTVSLTNSIDAGEYTLVSFADIVKYNSGKVSFEYWKIEGKNSLSKLQITDMDYKGFEYKALGVAKTKISINKSTLASIKTEPVGSLITFWFINIDYAKIAYLGYGWNKKSDYYLVDEEKSNIVTENTIDEYETESEYTGYYDQRYFLPMQQLTFVWQSYSSSLNAILSKGLTFNIDRGINKTIKIDVQTGQYSETNSTKSAIIPTSKNVLRIQSLPTEKINLAQ